MFWNTLANQCSVWTVLCENCGKQEAAAGTGSSGGIAVSVSSSAQPAPQKLHSSFSQGLFAGYITLFWLGIPCRWFYLHHRKYRMLISYLNYKLRGVKQESMAQVASEELDGSRESAGSERRMQTIVSL